MNLKRHLILASALVLGLSCAATYAKESDSIKLYTYYGKLLPVGIYAPVDISIVIDGQLMLLKNHPTPDNKAYQYSYVEVPAALEYKEITQAKFEWLRQGKKLTCTADELPLYVQRGDENTGTMIHFDCK